MRADFPLYCEMAANHVLGGFGGDVARRHAELFSASHTQEAALAFVAESSELDVSPLLAKIKALTLVLHRPKTPFVDTDVVRRVTACIPNARLVLLDDSVFMPIVGDMEEFVDPVARFLDGRDC